MSDHKRYTRRDMLVAGGLAAAIGAAVVVAVAKFREGISKVTKSAASPNGELGKEFQYDISELSRIDPALIAFDHSGKFQVDLTGPRGLAIDKADRIYVGGEGDVAIYSQQGRELSRITIQGRPNCLAVAENGNLFVGMKDHLALYSTDGKLAAKWPSLGSDSVVTSVAISGGDVVLADYGKRVVVHFDASGREINRIGNSKGDLAFEIPSPYFDIAFAPDGMLRVVNPGKLRIEAWMLDGNREFHWGAGGPDLVGFLGCCNPAHIAILPDGRIVTSEKGLQRIKVFKADRGFGQNGQLDCVVAGPETFGGSHALEIAADSKGHVIVLDPVAGTVHVFSPRAEAKGP